MSLTHKRALHAFTMIFFIVGMFYFYMMPGYPTGIYFVFAKTFDFLLILCILNPLSEAKWEWVCLGTFFVVRALWEIQAIKDYEKASGKPIIRILFCIDVLCLIIIFILQILKARR